MRRIGNRFAPVFGLDQDKEVYALAAAGLCEWVGTIVLEMLLKLEGDLDRAFEIKTFRRVKVEGHVVGLLESDQLLLLSRLNLTLPDPSSRSRSSWTESQKRENCGRTCSADLSRCLPKESTTYG